MGFTIGDTVVVISSFDNAEPGAVGVIAGQVSCYDNIYSVYFDTTQQNRPRGLHEDSSKNFFFGTSLSYYNIDGACLQVVSRSKTRMVRCCVCGLNHGKESSVKTKHGYICPACRTKKSYSTRNNKQVHKPVKNGFTFGFEFEAVPKSTQASAEMIAMGFIPTSDCSLCAYGIEYKSPIIHGRRGLMDMLNKSYGYLNFADKSCGQHINIGNTSYINGTTMAKIRTYRRELFNQLGDYMRDHSTDTKRLCGRNFGRFRAFDYNYVHGSWLNLNKNNVIEFRISKFKTPEQYYRLINMWCDMMDCINKNFLSMGGSDRVKSAMAKQTGAKLVKIFQEYASLS